MGDAADLAYEALESGQSLVWNELTEQIELVENIELMNSSMHGLMYLEECPRDLLEFIIIKYGIEIDGANDLISQIQQYFDP